MKIKRCKRTQKPKIKVKNKESKRLNTIGDSEPTKTIHNQSQNVKTRKPFSPATTPICSAANLAVHNSVLCNPEV